jgi:microcystin-dependent protein
MFKRLLAIFMLCATYAYADQPYLGEVRLFGFAACPAGWARAAGQLLSVANNPALFALYGTTYGGDGENSFGLPNLSGRAPVGPIAGSPLGSALSVDGFSWSAPPGFLAMTWCVSIKDQ